MFFDLIEGLQIHFKGMGGKERCRIIFLLPCKGYETNNPTVKIRFPE